MKFTIDQEKLTKAVAYMCRTIEARSTIPLLDQITIEAKKGQVCFIGTDLERLVIESVDCEVDKPGLTIVGAHKLKKVLSKLAKKGQTVVDLVDRKNHKHPKTGEKLTTDTVAVKVGKTNVKFKSIAYAPADMKQTHSAVAGDPGKLQTIGDFEVPGETLATMLERVSFAMSTEDTRYYLVGINVEMFQGRMLRLVATDGHRLARTERQVCSDNPDLQFGLHKGQSLIVPSKTVKILEAILKEGKREGSAKITVQSARVLIEYGNRQMITKIIDGSYPDYARVIPQSTDIGVKAGRDEVLETVKRLSAIGGQYQTVALRANGSVEMYMSNSDNDLEATEEIESGEKISGEFETGFNPKYMLDILTALPGDQVTIEAHDPGSPMLIHCDDRKFQDFAVLMPKRL